MKNKDKQNEQKPNSNKSLIVIVLLVIIILLIWFIAYLTTDNSNNTSIAASESKNSSTESNTETSENSINATELPDCCTIDANGNTVSSGDAQYNDDMSNAKLDNTHNKGYTKEQSREYLEDAIDYTMQLDDIQIDIHDEISDIKTIYLLRNGYIYENGESTGAKVLTSDILTDAVPVIEQLKDAEYLSSVEQYDMFTIKLDNIKYQINTSTNNDGQKFIKSIFRFVDTDGIGGETDLTVTIRDKSDFPD